MVRWSNGSRYSGDRADRVSTVLLAPHDYPKQHMIDHISIYVASLEEARPKYEATLKPLGYEILAEFPGVIGMGVSPKPDTWIAEEEKRAPAHIAFRATNHAMVDAFYAAGIAAGFKDNGAPGPRPQYHENYYGAFLLDTDGNNIEAVCHEAE